VTCGSYRSLTVWRTDDRGGSARDQPLRPTHDATATSEDPVALIDGIRTFLTAKAAPVAAATIVLGGGAAIAAPGVTLSTDDDAATTESVEDPGWAIGRADEEQLERIAAYCTENPEAAFCSGDSEDPIGWVPGASDDGEAEEGAQDAEEPADSEEPVDSEEEAEDGRSDTARRVHKALTGDPDIVPGDPAFGPTVSERARTGQLGGLVSRAARGEDLDADDLELDEPRRPGPPDHARGGAGNGGEDAEATGTAEAEPKAERRGPPPAASRGGNGNSGNRGPQGRGPRR
jgi:hypothetical protein